MEDIGVDGTGPAVQLFVQRNITSTEVAVPSGVIPPGRQFRWYVASENWRGYVRVESTFTSSGTSCVADFNGTDGVTLQDLFDFLTAWFANDLSADVNRVDGVTLQDLFDFLGLWFAGC